MMHNTATFYQYAYENVANTAILACDIGSTTTPTPEIEVKDAATNIANNANLAMGTTNVGVALTKILTINNIGTANLTLTNPVISGANAADFSITANPNNTVAGAGTTSFTISFTSAVAGTRNAKVTIANNDADENPFVINVSAVVTNNVLVNAITITIDDNDSIFFQGTSKSLSANVLPLNADNTNVIWSVSNITGSATINTNGQVFGLTGGLVKAKATAADGSGVFDEIELYIEKNAVRVNEVGAFKTLHIYPNPTQNTLYLSSIENINNIRVIEVIGNLILNESTNFDKIDFSGFDKGIYFVQVFSAKNDNRTFKIIRK